MVTAGREEKEEKEEESGVISFTLVPHSNQEKN